MSSVFESVDKFSSELSTSLVIIVASGSMKSSEDVSNSFSVKSEGSSNCSASKSI